MQIVNCIRCGKQMEVKYGSNDDWVCRDCRIHFAKSLHWTTLHKIFIDERQKENEAIRRNI